MATNNISHCHCKDSSSSESDDSEDENLNCIAHLLREPSSSINSKTNELLPDFSTYHDQNEECYMCNGYYESCFGNPVCATCHAFLFPDNVVNGEHLQALTEKSDDGDSGNDEPSELVFIDRGPYLERAEFVRDKETSNLPTDSLMSRLEMLSILSHRNKFPSSSIHIEVLPPEVLLLVFSYLDDFSLWNVANVCKRWRTLITYEIPPPKWEDLTLRRFPLFKPVFIVEDWFQAYSVLMNNCSCFACLKQMAVRTRPTVEEGSWRRNRLRSELKILRSDPPDGIGAIPLDPPTCCHWQATILGPTGSPYEGGLFFLYLQVPFSYPMCPPVVRFLTKIFHPNISRHGDVGIDSIHYNWSLALTLSKVLISVQSLLTDPYCKVCMEPEIGQLYLSDPMKFEMIAQEWTWRYAMSDLIPN